MLIPLRSFRARGRVSSSSTRLRLRRRRRRRTRRQEASWEPSTGRSRNARAINPGRWREEPNGQAGVVRNREGGFARARPRERASERATRNRDRVKKPESRYILFGCLRRSARRGCSPDPSRFRRSTLLRRSDSLHLALARARAASAPLFPSRSLSLPSDFPLCRARHRRYFNYRIAISVHRIGRAFRARTINGRDDDRDDRL